MVKWGGEKFARNREGAAPRARRARGGFSDEKKSRSVWAAPRARRARGRAGGCPRVHA